MTWSAGERISSTLLVLHTPVTSAPRVLAICTANMPTPSRCPVDQHGLAGLHLADIAQALPGGDRGDRHRCTLLEGQGGWAGGEQAPGDAGELGEATGGGLGVDVVPRAEPGHGRADRLDSAARSGPRTVTRCLAARVPRA